MEEEYGTCTMYLFPFLQKTAPEDPSEPKPVVIDAAVVVRSHAESNEAWVVFRKGHEVRLMKLYVVRTIGCKIRLSRLRRKNESQFFWKRFACLGQE